ncbi:MAG TPA: hypothetical protein VMX58_09620 [Patescibacteria group bacterium]|nr:hypothetical protein [Patescibacteria group bacterium]
MRSLTGAVLLLVILAAASPTFGQGPDLTGEMEAHKIICDENNREIAVPAESVYPHDMVEYTLKYRNSGNAAASGVNLVGPIPAGTVYLDQTATNIDGLHPLFSIDGGKTYHEYPVTYVVVDENGQEQEHVATPDMISHVKWMMSGTFDIGQQVSVSYRVQVQ